MLRGVKNILLGRGWNKERVEWCYQLLENGSTYEKSLNYNENSFSS